MNMKRSRRKFTAEYKDEVVTLYRTTEKTVSQLAKESRPDAVGGAALGDSGGGRPGAA